MDTIAIIIQSLLAAYYLFSGSAKLFGAKYWADIFHNLGLSPRFRRFTGIVQLAGAAALITGYWTAWAVIWACAWLGVTMLAACFVHVRVRDPFSKTAPAIVFAILILALFSMHANALPSLF